MLTPAGNVVVMDATAWGTCSAALFVMEDESVVLCVVELDARLAR